ncbi:MAG: hypothetical protein HY300_14255 [Verrucomicrobia bacterium]|nr:hypothetical protein [Verrucomicrobiota bacterium]
MKFPTFSASLPLCCCAALLLLACKPDVPAPVAPPAVAPAPAAAMPAPATGQPAPPVVTTRESNDDAYTKEMTQTMNEFLGEYIKANKRIPKDVGEMVGLKIITSVPMLPGGKKWVIDQQTGRISAK